MTFTYFTDRQILPLVVSSFILIASIVSFHLDKKRIALILLFLGSLGFGLFIGNLDNFLMIWDEQFHALVAKHMLDNPFKPTLYSTPLLDYDYRKWSANHIWLHKQPLFLWQIALSLKIFGINALAVRIPSIMLHAIATLMIYRIGKISNSQNVGFYGALFFSVAYHLLELIAGKYATDHNDISFMFYVTASFWAWFEYQNSQNKYWIILIGIFSGCAVLVKWLVGLLIYAVWTITVGVNDKNNWLKFKTYFPIFISFAISLLVFLPWQLFILHQYPLEAKYEFQLNTQHFFQTIENHSGNIWFHFNAVKNIYGSGDAVPFLILIGLFLYLKNTTTKIHRVAILFAILITYGFYTLAATKMTSFCIIVCPFGFLALGSLTDSLLTFLTTKIKFKKFEFIFRPFAVIAICFFLLHLSKIEDYHTDKKPKNNQNRNADVKQMIVIQKILDNLQSDKYVVFNADIRFSGHIPVMFYTNCVAYDFVPNQSQIEKIKMQSYKLAIIDDSSLPDYIQNDNEIVKFK
jgi:4-amino-4-deoxy-L-arabinose transferase-like glycosyltransferase